MSKIQVKSTYKDASLGKDEYDKYKDRQLEIHRIKADRKRAYQEYVICAKNMEAYIKDSGKMICLGTRNEYEKESFKKLLKKKNIRVFSQDIAELAKADYTCDFNELSKQKVPHDWDVVFSNCLDHAIDASITVNDWIKVINTGGILVMGFCFEPKVIIGDVCEFSQSSVFDFIRENKKLKLLNHYESGRWEYWTTKKL